jgi:hypothetical protein
VDFITDIVRVLEITLGTVVLGATPLHLPVPAFNWGLLPNPSGRTRSPEVDKTE